MRGGQKRAAQVPDLAVAAALAVSWVNGVSKQYPPLGTAISWFQSQRECHVRAVPTDAIPRRRRARVVEPRCGPRLGWRAQEDHDQDQQRTRQPDHEMQACGARHNEQHQRKRGAQKRGALALARGQSGQTQPWRDRRALDGRRDRRLAGARLLPGCAPTPSSTRPRLGALARRTQDDGPGGDGRRRWDRRSGRRRRSRDHVGLGDRGRIGSRRGRRSAGPGQGPVRARQRAAGAARRTRAVKPTQSLKKRNESHPPGVVTRAGGNRRPRPPGSQRGCRRPSDGPAATPARSAHSVSRTHLLSAPCAWASACSSAL